MPLDGDIINKVYEGGGGGGGGADAGDGGIRAAGRRRQQLWRAFDFDFICMLSFDSILIKDDKV